MSHAVASDHDVPVPAGPAGADGVEGTQHPEYPHPAWSSAAHPVPEDKATRFFRFLWTRPAWLAPLALLSCFAGAAGLVLANNPADGQPDPLGGCAFKLVTGFDCPGCGGTRAFWYLMHGNLPEAARHHALAVFAAPFLVYMYLVWTGKRLFPRLRMPQLRLTPAMLGWFLGAWGIYWVVRNLPWEPFTFLYV